MGLFLYDIRNQTLIDIYNENFFKNFILNTPLKITSYNRQQTLLQFGKHLYNIYNVYYKIKKNKENKIVHSVSLFNICQKSTNILGQLYLKLVIKGDINTIRNKLYIV